MTPCDVYKWATLLFVLFPSRHHDRQNTQCVYKYKKAHRPWSDFYKDSRRANYPLLTQSWSFQLDSFAETKDNRHPFSVRNQTAELNYCHYNVDSIADAIFVDVLVEMTNTDYSICQSNHNIYKYWDGSAVYHNALLWWLIIQFDDKLSKIIDVPTCKDGTGSAPGARKQLHHLHHPFSPCTTDITAIYILKAWL